MPELFKDRVFEDLPTFNTTLAISRSSITDIDIFKEFVELSDLKVVYEEPKYVIIEGTQENIQRFAEDWNCRS